VPLPHNNKDNRNWSILSDYKEYLNKEKEYDCNKEVLFFSREILKII